MPLYVDDAGTYKEGIARVEYDGVYVRVRRGWQDMDENGTYQHSYRPIWTKPTNVSAVADSHDQVTVSWDNAVPGGSLSDFQLADFSAARIDFTLDGSGKYEVEAFVTPTHVGGSTDFYYRISAGADWIFSGNSSTRHILGLFTNGDVVEVLAVAKTSGGDIGFAAYMVGTAGTTGTATADNIPTSFFQSRLYRNTTNDFGTATLIHTGNGTSQFVDTGRSESTEYWYWVLNRYDFIDGPVSDPDSVTTPAAPSDPQIAISGWGEQDLGNCESNTAVFFGVNDDCVSVEVYYRGPGDLAHNLVETIDTSAGGNALGDYQSQWYGPVPGGTQTSFRLIPYSGAGATGTQGTTDTSSGTTSPSGCGPS